MFEVEDWTQPSHSKRRTLSRRTTRDKELSDGLQTSYSNISPSALPLDPIPEIKSRTPSSSSPPPPPPTNNTVSAPHSHNNVPSILSSLRPGSRASHHSTKFSVGLIPALATGTASQCKASATTTLTEQAITFSAFSNDGSPFESPVTPSPKQSLPEVAGHRRWTSSYASSSLRQSTVVPSNPASTALDALSMLVNSWLGGMPFGRKKRKQN
jgi:autophagy-related protein 11